MLKIINLNKGFRVDFNFQEPYKNANEVHNYPKYS